MFFLETSSAVCFAADINSERVLKDLFWVSDYNVLQHDDTNRYLSYNVNFVHAKFV